MKNPAVDAYIAKSPAFARPMLKHLRALIHKACPRIGETLKWGVPAYERDGLVAMMAAFKQHVSFGFWNERRVREKLGVRGDRLFPKSAKPGMGGRRYHALAELPPAVLIVQGVKAAVALNEAGERPKRVPKRKPPPKAPADLLSALGRDAAARATWARFTPAQQRDYVDWLTEAKQAATRARRLAQAIQWMAEGKRRNWKYERC